MTVSLIDQIRAGHRRAVARLLTHVENEHPRVGRVLDDLYAGTGQAHLVGVTGAPGTGKSSLVNKLVKSYRRSQDKKTAVLAVDPTSPFTGGAILGDRVRMQELAGDPGVFIRSLASRGSLGGLAKAVDDAIKVLDAAGFEVIFIETVGAGQGEVEIAKTAHTVIVVEAPGLGDDVQAIKAGILEIADIFVVNKADRAGADRTASALRTMLELGSSRGSPSTPRQARRVEHHPEDLGLSSQASRQATSGSGRAAPSGQANEPESQTWAIPVLKTATLKEEGVDAVIAAIERHLVYLKESSEWTRRHHNRLREELDRSLQAALMQQLKQALPAGYMAGIVAQLAAYQLTPAEAIQKILAEAEE